MEELILHYYIKVFSISLSILLVASFLLIYNSLNKKLLLQNNIIDIQKGEKLESVLKLNIKNISIFDLYIIKIYYEFNNILFNTYFHFGDFYIEENKSSINFLNIISKPSNILNKITIVEGWSKLELNKELSKFFEDFNDISYEDIIADTYFFEKNSSFDDFVKKLNKTKNDYFNNVINNKIFNSFSEEEIIIIGSLLEKEGLDYNDKKYISSVILNRLNKKMKLQIDATVIYAITNGKYNLNRKLLLNDLKYVHSYNTYINYGLPPRPISYVGKKTLDIILENFKSQFLFYFFDKSLNRHIFSKTYDEHKKKLNEFRSKK